jgi:hypothetical protein
VRTEYKRRSKPDQQQENMKQQESTFVGDDSDTSAVQANAPGTKNKGQKKDRKGAADEHGKARIDETTRTSEDVEPEEGRRADDAGPAKEPRRTETRPEQHTTTAAVAELPSPPEAQDKTSAATHSTGADGAVRQISPRRRLPRKGGGGNSEAAHSSSSASASTLLILEDDDTLSSTAAVPAEGEGSYDGSMMSGDLDSTARARKRRSKQREEADEQGEIPVAEDDDL